ncbi:tryptophan 7-halogenase [Altericista sp. CCNU0014]|uniref:tryptophan 7-halogenase n=1 Tax=Altericista sp. CCNU0014 TaxID=3082949 RepID=UPI00384B579F
MGAPIQTVVILGGGSAGFLCALALKTKIPQLSVTVVRAPEIPIVGVGEATTAWMPWFLHEYLGLDRQEFYDKAQPVWKLGIRFIWGPDNRPYFNYPFDAALTAKAGALSKNTGYYCLHSTQGSSLYSHLMARGKSPCFRTASQELYIDEKFGYHIENSTFVAYLTCQAAKVGVRVLNKTFVEAKRKESGAIESLYFKDGTTLPGDLFVDCSGFRSVLLGGTLRESFTSFANSLFCDSAVTGTWMREDSIQPFTTAETMESGWCWRIDLTDRVNRGYVYASAFASDEAAAAELKHKNPQLELDGKLIRFKSGRYGRSWVQNVVAVGNASGFVEPLESTGLHMICETAKMVCDVLLDSDRNPSESLVGTVNRSLGKKWDDIRNFLAIHFRLNRRVSSEFWKHCWNDVELDSARELIDFFQDNGPSLLAQSLLPSESVFGLNGYFNLLIDQGIKPRVLPFISAEERQVWQHMLQQLETVSHNALTVKDAFLLIQNRQGKWLVPQLTSGVR